jgi:hypothetical protein
MFWRVCPAHLFGELLKPRKLRLSFNAAAVAMNLFKLNRDVT